MSMKICTFPSVLNVFEYSDPAYFLTRKDKRRFVHQGQTVGSLVSVSFDGLNAPKASPVPNSPTDKDMWVCHAKDQFMSIKERLADSLRERATVGKWSYQS
jgi:hypothetical protein